MFEKVNPSHPDKVADRIAGAMVDLAYEKQTEASVDLEAIRKTALNRLGMHYATESQIRYYSAEENSYVRQYGTVTN